MKRKHRKGEPCHCKVNCYGKPQEHKQAWMRKVRERAGMTQADVAGWLMCGRSAVGHWETGRLRAPHWAAAFYRSMHVAGGRGKKSAA